MKRRIGAILSVAIAMAFGFAIGSSAFAQDDGMSASQSMSKAGESIENAGADTAEAAKHTYRGVKTALTDTTITAKVKTALHLNKVVNEGDIAVSTVAGVVTLKGQVHSREAASKAEEVARTTEGVRAVDNELLVMNTNATTD